MTRDRVMSGLTIEMNVRISSDLAVVSVLTAEEK